MSRTLLRVGTFTRSLLIHLAQRDGSFARAGLEVEEYSVTSSPAQFRSLVSGEYDLVLTSPDNVLAYRFLPDNPLGETLPVQILSSVDRGLELCLCLAPGLAGVEEVRGGVLGVDVPQSGFAFLAFALLERLGVRPGEYEIEAMGSTPRRGEALVRGECAATILNAGNELRARRAGCQVHGRASDVGPYLGSVVAALVTEDDERRAARQSFVDVILGVSRDIVAGARRDEVLEAAVGVLSLSERDATAYHEGLFSIDAGLIPSGAVDPAELATLVALRRAYRPSAQLEGLEERFGEVVSAHVLGRAASSED